MKCPGQLRIDRDLNIEFTTGFIFRDHAASVGGMGLDKLLYNYGGTRHASKHNTIDPSGQRFA